MSVHFKPKYLAAALAAVFVSTESKLAFAQLEEVVVTARKKEESLQDVPVVVQALSGEALQASGTTTFQDLNDQITGLTIQNSATVSPSISLRGITSDQTNVANDSAVSINVDGVQHSSAQIFRFGLFDLQSVEVLKGPQALFYGKNSPGGIISMKTNDPTDELFTEVQVGYEEAAERMWFHGIVSGAFNDTWGGRLGIKYTDQEGFFENVWGKGDPDAERPFESHGPNFDSTLLVGTVKGVFDSGDVTFKLYHGEQEGADYSLLSVLGACSQTPIPSNPYATCKVDDTYSNAPWTDRTGSRFGASKPFTDYQLTQFTISGNYDINDTWSVANVIGLIDIQNDYFGNVGTRSDGPAVSGSLALGSSVDIESFSEEIRFLGSFENFELMAGAFFDDRSTTGGANVWLLETLTARPDAEVQVDGESWSVFAQADIYLTEDLELSLGARYTEEERSIRGRSFEDYTFVNGVTYNGGKHYFANPTIEFNDLSPELTLSWRPLDNVNVFGSYKEGFKSGGYNSSTQDATTSNTSRGIAPRENDYANENISGYEVGVKLELLDNNLRVNAAAYTYDYTEMQLPVVALVDGTPAPKTVNAGKSKIEGVEVDALWLTPWDALMVSGNLAYSDGRYEDYVSECSEWQLFVDGRGCDRDLNQQDRSGDSLQAAPLWSGSVGLMYDDVLTDKLRLRANLSASYKDEQQLESFNDPRGMADSYWILNSRVGVYADDESWSVDLIVRNMTDEATPIYVIRNVNQVDPVVGGQPMGFNRNNPREIALQFTFRPDMFF